MRQRYTFGCYLAGATAARTGDEMSGPALLLFGFASTGNAVAATTLLAALTASAAIGGPCLGALLDRSTHPGRLLALGLAGYAAGLIAILGSLGQAPTPIVIAIAAVTGLLNPAIAGGWTAQLPQIRNGKLWHRVNAVDALTFSTANLVGPALAGLLANQLGAAPALAVAISFVAMAVPVALLLPGRTERERDASQSGYARALFTGFTALFGNRALLRATTTSTVSYVGVGMFIACCPLIGAQRLGEHGDGAILLSALTAMAVLANTVLARLPARWSPGDATIGASTLIMAGGTLLVAATNTLPLIVLGVAILGIGEGPQLTALFAVRHREAPKGTHAHVFTTGASMKITGFAIGAGLAGPLATASLTVCLLTAMGAQLLAGATYLAYSTRRPSPAPAA